MTVEIVDYEGWTLADEGICDGVQYVTVLDPGLNPIQYNISAHEAEGTYGLTLERDACPEYL